MTSETFRFHIRDPIALDDAELALGLALASAEGLYGGASVRLGASYRRVDADRAFILKAGTEVGEAVVRMFTGLLTRQFGGQAFSVARESLDQATFPGSGDPTHA